MHIAHGKEIFLLVVLEQERHEVIEFSRGTVENLALAVHYVFLQIEGNRLGGAEILHCVGNSDSHLLAETEIMVNCCPGREYHGGEIGNSYFRLTEFLGGETLHFYERSEINLYAVLFGYFIVR